MDNKISKCINFYSMQLGSLFSSAKGTPSSFVDFRKLSGKPQFKVDSKIFGIELINVETSFVFGILSTRDTEEPVDLQIRQSNNNIRNILNDDEQLEKFTFFYMNYNKDDTITIAAFSSKLIPQFDKCFDQYLYECGFNMHRVVPEIIDNAESEIENVTTYISSNIEFDGKNSNELMKILFDLNNIENNDFVRKLEISINFEKNNNLKGITQFLKQKLKPSKNTLTLKKDGYDYVVDAIQNTLTRNKSIKIDRSYFSQRPKYTEIQKIFSDLFSG